MSNNNILGLIFANTNESNLPELTAHRTMGSVPFGGKYRLIDFPLSNMSNAGINNVGIITKSNFLSLMDHLGSGSAWDLARRRSGMTILPPYREHSFDSMVETINNLHGFIENSDEEYVLIAPSDCVTNIDYTKVLAFHQNKDADITLVFSEKYVHHDDECRAVLELDDNCRATRIMKNPDTKEKCLLATGSFLMKKELLMTIIRKCVPENKLDFLRDVIQANVTNLKIFGYENPGYNALITCIKDYFRVSMELMDSSVRAELFNPKRPIYTKVRDDIPSKYGLNSTVSGSLIAQGCVINGTVTNSIISKGVYIGQNTKVSNCIIMQDTVIGDNADISYVIIDKDVNIGAGRSVMGCDTYPMYIAKRSVI